MLGTCARTRDGPLGCCVVGTCNPFLVPSSRREGCTMYMGLHRATCAAANNVAAAGASAGVVARVPHASACRRHCRAVAGM